MKSPSASLDDAATLAQNDIAVFFWVLLEDNDVTESSTNARFSPGFWLAYSTRPTVVHVSAGHTHPRCDSWRALGAYEAGSLSSSISRFANPEISTANS
jgi:hypothetical protein